jgi:hypothetical protein
MALAEEQELNTSALAFGGIFLQLTVVTESWNGTSLDRSK